MRVICKDKRYIIGVDEKFKYVVVIYEPENVKMYMDSFPLNTTCNIGKGTDWNVNLTDDEKTLIENAKEDWCCDKEKAMNGDYINQIKEEYKSIKRNMKIPIFNIREIWYTLKYKYISIISRRLKMKANEVDKLIEKVSANIREAHELLKEARDLSSDIDFDELKNSIDIKKYSDTIHYIAQDLSFIQVGCISGLGRLYNQEFWRVLDKVYLEKNNLACLLDVLPDKFDGSADEYMWEDLKNEFRKIAYHPDNDGEIIDKVHEFYENKTKEELTVESKGFCKDYVNKKGDTGILSGEWWIEEGIAKILENYWILEVEKGDKNSLEEV